MTFLSVNINKIATLRNSRGKNTPHLLNMTEKILGFGAKGITVHPRPDERHIKRSDIHDLKVFLATKSNIEFNIEGYPSAEFLELVCSTSPTQCTLVPDPPDTLTSNAGWDLNNTIDVLKPVVKILRQQNIRSALFIDPATFDDQHFQALLEINPDRVELYTERFADTFGHPENKSVVATYAHFAKKISHEGIKINAGHDLNQENLAFFLRSAPEVSEVSIGHAIFCEALNDGLEKTIKSYLKICELS